MFVLAVGGALQGPPQRAAVGPKARHVLAESATEETFAEVMSDADSVPKALADLWRVIASPPEGGAVLRLPGCEALRSPSVRGALFEHLECCKDSCDSFGSRVVAAPEAGGGIRVRRLAQGAASDPYAFADDDDDDDDDFLSPEMRAMLAGLGDDDDDGGGGGGGGFLEDGPRSGAHDEFEALDDAGVERCCKDWVNAIVSDAGICPFSLSSERAGLPLGDVRYDVTRAADAETVYAWYWKEVAWLEDHPKYATSLLLLADDFWLKNLEAFETFGASLAQALQTGTEGAGEGLAMENALQLVFFHPDYVFRDGGDHLGADAAANFARRSPYPMINILRTPQVRAAQKGLPTGLVYKQNEETLRTVGAPLLEEMLRTRDWAAMDGNRVDRTKIEVLKLARGMMEASAAPTDDLSKTGAAAEQASNCPAAAATQAAAPPRTTRDAEPLATANAAAEHEDDCPFAAAAAARDDLQDWASAVDDASGRTYYYHTKTQATSWTWPP